MKSRDDDKWWPPQPPTAMALVNRLKEFVGEEDAPTTYECPECDRRFEVDAPPRRVICSACGNGDVRQVDR